jgi:hypothetical protein
MPALCGLISGILQLSRENVYAHFGWMFLVGASLMA